MPSKICLQCGRLYQATRGVDDRGRCPTHRAEHMRAVYRAVDARRPNAAQRGYDSAWRKVRAEVLERDGHTCWWCGDVATTVDHVVSLARGGARLDPDNLVASCRRDNSARGGRTRRVRPAPPGGRG